ncbi:MAG: hypothetical protein IPL61_07485 [Myxococcales bacterium]|nr:hypothetical protein [Myxococcales bacterium]
MIDHEDDKGKRRLARGSLAPTGARADAARPELADELEAADPSDDDDDDLDDEPDAELDDAEVVADGDAEVTVAGVDGEVPELSRKIRRRRRRTRPRSKTIAMKRLTREELRQGALMYPPDDEPRPRTRAECKEELRPCPWVACKFHLYLDVNPETGSIKINFPELEPWDLPHTCSLDIAERGGITLEEVGEIMNLTRERIRQVEVRGLLRLKMASPSPEEIGAALVRRPGQ